VTKHIQSELETADLRSLQARAIINQSELAHFGQISTTGMTQNMWPDNLAPDIQEEILCLPRITQGRY
jgi:hypothetical protein